MTSKFTARSRNDLNCMHDEFLTTSGFDVPSSEPLLWHLEHHGVLPNFTEVDVVLAWSNCFCNRAPVDTKTEPADVYHHARLQRSNACHRVPST